MSRRARRYHRDLLEESRVTSDPTLRTVFTSDAVSVSADVLALAAVALNQITGSSIPQGLAAVLIALVLIRLSLRLIQRSHDFLVGAWAGTAGSPPPSGRVSSRVPAKPQPLCANARSLHCHDALCRRRQQPGQNPRRKTAGTAPAAGALRAARSTLAAAGPRAAAAPKSRRRPCRSSAWPRRSPCTAAGASGAAPDP